MKQAHDAESATCNPDLELLFELEAGLLYIQEDFASVTVSLQNLLPENKITFSTLWTLFQPGSLILARNSLEHMQAFNLRTAQEIIVGTTRYLQLTVDFVDWDGEQLGFSPPRKFLIAQFAGAKTIPSLAYYPLDCHPDADNLKQRLLTTATKTMKYHATQIVEYKGLAMSHGEGRRSMKFNVGGISNIVADRYRSQRLEFACSHRRRIMDVLY